MKSKEVLQEIENTINIIGGVLGLGIIGFIFALANLMIFLLLLEDGGGFAILAAWTISIVFYSLVTMPFWLRIAELMGGGHGKENPKNNKTKS